MVKFNLKIVSKQEAEKLLWARGIDHYKHIISIGEPTPPGLNPVLTAGTPNPDRPKGLDDQMGRVLRMEFRDVEKPTIPGGPEIAHIQTLIDFAKGIDEGNALVHCYAGISRSSAAAAITFFVHTQDEQEAIDRMYNARRKEVRPLLMPNTLMLKHADDLLGSDLMLACLSVTPPPYEGE